MNCLSLEISIQYFQTGVLLWVMGVSESETAGKGTTTVCVTVPGHHVPLSLGAHGTWWPDRIQQPPSL
jgi:hypothetical protein